MTGILMQSKISKKIKVELASTPQQIQFGLMYRKSINSDSGMLFVFGNKDRRSFWGANTYIPLDIAFINDNKIVDIKKIVPLSTKPVKCEELCDKALEVSANFFENNGIKVGSSVEIDKDEIAFLM